MNIFTSTLTILAIASVSATALAGDVDTVSFGQRFVDRNCTWCHGPSTQGFTTAPRLAGQRRQYLENQLLSFKNHARDNPLSQQYMWAAAVTVSPETARNLAAYLSSLEAQSANDGDKSLTATGETIYQQGIQGSNIPACVACHGPKAEGVGAIPRLGGLSYYYLRRKLGQWGEGYHAAALAPMPEVANKLSANDIEALASYLSFVR
jgi:cytochrome c553